MDKERENKFNLKYTKYNIFNKVSFLTPLI